MGLQEFPSKPVNKGGVIIGTVNGPTEVAIGAENSYLVADSTTTPGAKWQTYRKYNTVQLTSGTSWTVPAAVEMIDVLLIGGGEGGSGVSTAATANSGNNGNGGAGGGVLYKRNYPVTPGATITYSIGSGGGGAASPAPTASTTTAGSPGGNTTFDGLVAPGAASIYGNSTTWTGTNNQKSFYRGIYNFGRLDSSYGNTTATVNNHYSLAKINLDWNTMFWGSFVNTATQIQSTYWPAQPTINFTGWSNPQSYMGISNTSDKLLSAYTAPTGSDASLNELTANVKLSGWAGYGGTGERTTVPYIAPLTWQGGGQGGSISTSTTGSTRSANGGAAATNSGAGGGGGSVITGSTTVAGASGGAGGSGVIFIGYWA